MDKIKQQEHNVSVPKELLEELLDNTIECHNNNQWRKDSWGKDRDILTRYQNEINQVTKLLKSI